MKVICINDSEWGQAHKSPAVGEELTVSEDYIDFEGDPVYEFVEYGDMATFEQKYFAPLSDLDETELVTEEFEEKYYVPINK
jgi:hypothetical protein